MLCVHLCHNVTHFVVCCLLCFAFMLSSTSIFTQWETNWKTASPPSPFCDTPPFDNSMLRVTFSWYLCPFQAYLFLVVHVSLDTKGNACIA